MNMGGKGCACAEVEESGVWCVGTGADISVSIAECSNGDAVVVVVTLDDVHPFDCCC